MESKEPQVRTFRPGKEEEKPTNPLGHVNEAAIPGTDSTTVNPKYLTGYSLVIMMASVTTISFLMLLDASIIATVSINYLSLQKKEKRKSR